MGNFEFVNSVAGLIAALCAVAAYRFNLAQTNKTRSELIDKLEIALDSKRKHSVCELFYMLYGLRMDYEDIKEICKISNSIKVIYALKKTPGMVKYENGIFTYSGLFRIEMFRKSINLITKVMTYFLSMVVVILIVLMGIVQGTYSVAIGLVLIPLSVFLWYQLREIRYDNMIHSLVSHDGK